MLQVQHQSALSRAFESTASQLSGGVLRTAKLSRAGLFSRSFEGEIAMIRKLKDGRYRLYSRKKNPKTAKRRNLGTFRTRAAAEKHERAVQFFKRGG